MHLNEILSSILDVTAYGLTFIMENWWAKTLKPSNLKKMNTVEDMSMPSLIFFLVMNEIDKNQMGILCE